MTSTRLRSRAAVPSSTLKAMKKVVSVASGSVVARVVVDVMLDSS